jgi:hypothetical protein
MKIVITYGPADISRVIRQDLARQGITAADADIKYTKNSVIVSVEATVDDAPIAVEEPVRAPAPTPELTPRPAVATLPPALEVVEGGAGPVDMSAVLRDSKRIATSTEGKFPTPKHSMLEGESTEWPGDR